MFVIEAMRYCWWTQLLAS